MYVACLGIARGVHARLDDGLAAGVQRCADDAKVGRQVLVPHRLDHLAAHHLQRSGQAFTLLSFSFSKSPNMASQVC
jgi:hypothetical protein